MAGKSFFQDIFCAGEVNEYVRKIDNDAEAEDKLEEVAMNIFSHDVVVNEEKNIINDVDIKSDITNKKVDESLGVVFNSDIMVEDEHDISGFNHVGVTGATGMQGSKEINNNRNIDINMEPVVSGLIFDEKNDNDESGFFVKPQAISDVPIEEDSSDPIELINMLMQEGVKEEKSHTYYEEPKKVESEVDLPFI